MATDPSCGPPSIPDVFPAGKYLVSLLSLSPTSPSLSLSSLSLPLSLLSLSLLSLSPGNIDIEGAMATDPSYEPPSMSHVFTAGKCLDSLPLFLTYLSLPPFLSLSLSLSLSLLSLLVI